MGPFGSHTGSLLLACLATIEKGNESLEEGVCRGIGHMSLLFNLNPVFGKRGEELWEINF